MPMLSAAHMYDSGLKHLPIGFGSYKPTVNFFNNMSSRSYFVHIKLLLSIANKYLCCSMNDTLREQQQQQLQLLHFAAT